CSSDLDLRDTICDVRGTRYDLRDTIYDVRGTMYEIRFAISMLVSGAQIPFTSSALFPGRNSSAKIAKITSAPSAGILQIAVQSWPPPSIAYISTTLPLT